MHSSSRPDPSRAADAPASVSDSPTGLAAVFHGEGERIEAGGNAPLLLEDPGVVWMVAEGKLHVFVVDIVDDRPQGPRDYLFSLEAGDVIFGMEPEWADEAGLLASGVFGTGMLRLSLQRFREVAAQSADACGLIDGYVTAFSSAVSHRNQPRFDVLIAPGEATSVAADTAMAPQKDVSWIVPEDGRALFDGSPSLVVGPPAAPFPLAWGAWVLSADPLNVTVHDTETVLRSGEIWSGLQSFQRIALEWAQETLEKDRALERERLVTRVDSDNEAHRAALESLATVMDHGPATPTSDEGGLMFRACQAVGRASRIEMLPAPAWESGRGVRDELRAIARASAVGYRRVMLPPGWWQADSGPLLGFIASKSDTGDDVATPVALLPVGASAYDLYDPEQGSSIEVNDEVAASLEPFGYGFLRSLPATELRPLDLLRFVSLGLMRDIRTVLMMGFLGALLGLVGPVLTGYLFDTVIPTADGVQLVHLFLAMIVVSASGLAFQLTRGVAITRLQSRVVPTLQIAVLDRLVRLPVPFFRRFSAGDLGLRAGAVTEIGQTLGGATISSIMSSIVSASAYVLLFYYSVQLALLATVILAITAGFTVIMSHFALRYQRQLQEVEGRISGLVLQFLSGIAKLRVSSSEARAFAHWGREFREQRRLRFRVASFHNNVGVFNAVLSIASTMAIYWFYTTLATRPGGGLTTGDFLAFNAAYGTFMAAGLDLAMTGVGLISLIPTWERAKPILEEIPEVDRANPDPGELNGRIEVSHLAFRYHADAPYVLHDLSFEADPGEFIALVGPSGAGKSTLLRVLLGFEVPESSSVYYDGHDLACINVTAVRRQIGVVLQSSKLTSGDIFTNIVGSTSLTLSDAWDAARMAGMEEDLKAMPMGMHTVVSEGGGTLSGGQRQRLLIARALVTKPRILFFDEATSALDNRTQRIVSESIEQLHATRVVIAHRLSTIRNASRIYVLEQGHTVQAGSFDELMAQPGLFADLASRQEA